jgi:uncharacterized protein YndB with AHSA1/START domain
MTDQVSVSREIRRPPAEVWAMVADLTRMGEWSPENLGARWVGGATGPAPGARFRGRNRHGWRQWTTAGVVREAEPGRRLIFDITAVGVRVARWIYEFEPTAEGCRVTETWIDQRGGMARALGKPVSGVADRAAHNRAGMEQTLERLAAAAESGAPA